MRSVRTLTVGALGALAVGGAAWLLAGPAFAQSPAPGTDGAAPLKRANRVMITVAGPAIAGAPLHDVLGPAPAHDLTALLAEALGVGKDELTAAQAQGQSLDDIAQAHGTTKRALLDKVQTLMREDMQAKLDQAVADGKLTREQADKMLDGFKVVLDLDTLPEKTLALPGAPGHLFRFFKDGDAQGSGPMGDTFEFAVPAPGEPGGLPDFLPAQPAIAAVDEATISAVRGVLADAVTAGKLTQDQVDTVLKRLELRMMPAIRYFGSIDSDGDSDGAVAPTSPRAARPL